MFDTRLRRRVVGGWIAVALMLFVLVPAALGVSPKPALNVTVVCTPQAPLPDGTPQWSIDHYASVSGFPPSAEISVVIVIDDFGDFREITFTTDAAGVGSGQLLQDPSYFNSGPLPTGEPWTATARTVIGQDELGQNLYGPVILTVSGTLNCGGPLDKTECKKGGSATFGMFKNQGDCVSFVSTGFSNAPAGP
jgi:hypothetical protein